MIENTRGNEMSAMLHDLRFLTYFSSCGLASGAAQCGQRTLAGTARATRLRTVGTGAGPILLTPLSRRKFVY